jgi:hypothetical protein
VTVSQIKNYHRQQTKIEEQTLYDYFLKNVQEKPPEQLLEDFYHLFIEGRSYKDAHIFSALEKIVKAKDADQSFNFFFNRCCYILINHWLRQPQLESAIPSLISLFENLVPARSGNSNNTSNCLRKLLKNYIESDCYGKMRRLARIIINQQTENEIPSVGHLVQRYPYLYDACLLCEESSYEHQQTVRHLKSRTKRRFEVALSHYVTYRGRLARMTANGSGSEGAERLIRPLSNPTLLSERELTKSLSHFVGSIEGCSSYRDLAQNFLMHSLQASTLQAFKDDLYEYLLTSIDPQYGKRKFNQRLYQVIQNTLPECDFQKPNEFLLLRMSTQLLNFLVVENTSQPNPYVFTDLIVNIGVTRTVGVLLKILLICHKVKPDLEKRLAILFTHYESFDPDEVPWLVKVLENLQVVFSIHFGKADLSCLKQITLD